MYQEFILNTVFLIMWVVVAIFTPIVLFVMVFMGEGEPFPVVDFVILMALNVFCPAAVFLSRKGHWRFFGHIVPLVLLFLGNYGVWNSGILTSFILFYAVIVVLTGMFHNIGNQIFIVGVLAISIAGVIEYRGYSWDESLPGFILVVALLLGIGYLQSLSSALLWRIVDHNQGLSKNLREENLLRQAREIEIEEINLSLDAQVRLRTAQLAAKHNELADLYYSMAHDLRAPLRAVIGFNQILREESSSQLNEDSIDLISRSIEAGRRMDSLIESILTLSKIGEAELVFEVFNIEDMVIQAFVDIKNDELIENAELIICDCPQIKADRGLVWILIKNLVSNALKFSKCKDQLRVEFGCESQDAGKVVYFIRDNGIGFPMEYAEKVFEPFHQFTEDRDCGGVGIGLSIARRVIERHGGAIWAESNPDDGTIMYFSFIQH